jgi:hypothetical protein
MIARNNAIIPLPTATSLVGKEGYFVKIVDAKAAIVTAVDDKPIGVILDASPAEVSVALIGGGLAGTVKVKLDGTPGTCILGSPLEITATGTVKVDTGGGTETVVAIALEAGAANELIEAVLLNANGTITLQQSFNTSVAVANADPADGTALVTGQVKDAAGNALAGRFAVAAYFGEAAHDGVPYDFGDLTAASGTVILKEHTTDAYAVILTKSDGSWGLVLDLGSDDTVHASAWVQGKIATANVAITGNQ